jgi:hypothetical protein
MNDLPRSLEDRSREWINTPPQYRDVCPGCGARYGYTADDRLGFEHGVGCWTKANAHDLVFGKRCSVTGWNGRQCDGIVEHFGPHGTEGW